MLPSDLTLLHELTLTLDLAYLYYCEHTHDGSKRAALKSAEASIRLAFGNFWYRQVSPSEEPGPPIIEEVVIYSSIFSAGKVCHFDSLDTAIATAKHWLEYARELNC